MPAGFDRHDQQTIPAEEVAGGQTINHMSAVHIGGLVIITSRCCRRRQLNTQGLVFSPCFFRRKFEQRLLFRSDELLSGVFEPLSNEDLTCLCRARSQCWRGLRDLAGSPGLGACLFHRWVAGENRVWRIRGALAIKASGKGVPDCRGWTDAEKIKYPQCPSSRIVLWISLASIVSGSSIREKGWFLKCTECSALIINRTTATKLQIRRTSVNAQHVTTAFISSRHSRDTPNLMPLVHRATFYVEH